MVGWLVVHILVAPRRSLRVHRSCFHVRGFFNFSPLICCGEQYVQKILDGFLGEILVSTIARTPIVLSFLELNSIHRAVSQVWEAYF